MINYPSKLTLLLSTLTLAASSLCAFEQTAFTMNAHREPSSEDSCSEDTSLTDVNTLEQTPPCETTLEHPPEMCAYSAPFLSRSNPCTDLYLTGSFIYWRASADYLSPAFLDHSFSPDPGALANVLFNGKTLEPDFEYKPGFQVGLGYTFQRDRWDVYAEYTQFHQTTHSSDQVKPGGEHMHAIWLTFITPVLIGDGFRSYTSKWTTDFDILDVEVGRDFFCGQKLTFRPSLGLRALWLEQKYNLKYVSLTDAIPVYSNNRSSSWGIGPRFALCNAWNLYKGLKIVGDLGLSLLHVEDQVRIKHRAPILLTFGEPSDITYQNKESISLVKPIFDLSLGLGWQRPLFREKCALDLELTYDYSIYWDQASIQLGHAPIVAPGSPIQVIVGNAALSTGNISIQGLKATIRFDF